MVTVPEGLGLLKQQRGSIPEVLTTGLSGLDAATGGFVRGQVWIVIGTPGQGRSTLATQWAWLLASQHGLTTHLVSQTDPATRVAARVASMAAKVPLNHLWRDGLRGQDEERLQLVGSTLESAPLELHGPGDLSVVDADVPERPLPEALVVDDAQAAGGMTPSRIASIVARGALVVLTMPRRLLVSDTDVDLVWAEVADFVLDINRPDSVDPSSIRPGEADLRLIRNRWGPTHSVLVAFQAHYARFVDLSAG